MILTKPFKNLLDETTFIKFNVEKISRGMIPILMLAALICCIIAVSYAIAYYANKAYTEIVRQVSQEVEKAVRWRLYMRTLLPGRVSKIKSRYEWYLDYAKLRDWGKCIKKWH